MSVPVQTFLPVQVSVQIIRIPTLNFDRKQPSTPKHTCFGVLGRTQENIILTQYHAISLRSFVSYITMFIVHNICKYQKQ